MVFWRRKTAAAKKPVKSFSREEKRWREERKLEILEGLEGDQRARLAAILDYWVIEDVEVNGEPGFLPRPLWDNEALLTRNSFPTLQEAEAEVADHGAELLPERHPFDEEA